MQSAETLLKNRALIGQLLVGIILNRGGSKHLPESNGHSFGNAENISEDRHGNSIMANRKGDKILFNARQRSLTPTLLFFVLSAAAFGQSPKPDWSDWKFMLGEWTAIQSSGMPGSASTASFSLVPDLQGMILLRKNHAEYPPAIVHEDLMVVYREDGKTRAFYEDTEGHIIRYEIAVADKKIVMLSEMIAGAPRFRLT